MAVSKQRATGVSQTGSRPELARKGGSSHGALTAAGLSCGSCDAELRGDDKFCPECGAQVTPASKAAEYKQVTVLFADVVHSMDIAVAVG
jgi:hypothetical protein